MDIRQQKSHKTHKRLIIFASICCFLFLFVWGGTKSRILGASYTALDPSTKRSLDKLNKLMLTGNREQVMDHLKRVINSAGYIKPLAEIYYRLAQNETDLNSLSELYGSIIEHWPTSAWAQKAVTEFIPLILMSEGKIGQPFERIIWKEEKSLLSLADDASDIGEKPELLRSDVRYNLIYLAHYRKEAVRVKGLIKNVSSPEKSPNGEIDLANAYATLRLEQYPEAEKQLKMWLDSYPQSELRPFALLALFHALKNEQEKGEIIQEMQEKYPDTLEAKELSTYYTLPQ